MQFRLIRLLIRNKFSVDFVPSAEVFIISKHFGNSLIKVCNLDQLVLVIRPYIDPMFILMNVNVRKPINCMSFFLSSALDAESEFLVQDALEKLMLDRTVITIAHRLSTIRSANQIAVLDLGVVAELGPYQELLKIENGIFRKLVERQTIVQ